MPKNKIDADQQERLKVEVLKIVLLCFSVDLRYGWDSGISSVHYGLCSRSY